MHPESGAGFSLTGRLGVRATGRHGIHGEKWGECPLGDGSESCGEVRVSEEH